MTSLFAKIEEVSSLLAFIELNPQLPYAHLASQYAILATHALETQIEDTKPTEEDPLALRILRLIAEMSVQIVIEDAIRKGDIARVALEAASNGAPAFALAIACECGQTAIVELLLNTTVINPAAKNNAAIQIACARGHTEIVRLLLNLPLNRDGVGNVDPSANNNLPLLHACEFGHTEIVRLLLNLPLNRDGVGNVDPSIDNNLPLHVACENGHTEIIRLLLDLPLNRDGVGNVDPSACNNHALIYACENGHTEIVHLLLDLPLNRDGVGNVDPSTDNNHALIYACKFGHTEIVRLLLNLPLNRDGVGNVNVFACESVPFVYACHSGKTKIMQMLFKMIKSDVNINFKLLIALARGHTELIRWLEEKSDSVIRFPVRRNSLIPSNTIFSKENYRAIMTGTGNLEDILGAVDEGGFHGCL